ncbi:anti-sigma regulatory factor (Ser/Thr protein kinase) [Pedobacter cryoconitis]|uniref:serine/threonine protein kinase n=1 Tax=Pedobacter cryoconitis TaxID=188932 RepID=UPI00161F16D0|nr:serine/threonine protein kinase [Pedobacter cryoconitis]MBB6270557.1 anti-sigma regulatory factor (Ser/Thr protein kinase) [Pedobacter cryoconitis]
MVDATHISFAANDRSYFSLLKKEIHRKVLEAGMEAARVAEVDIIVAEITSNLFKYADEGEILFGSFKENGVPYIELISIDNGPGMIKASRMVQDGVTTSNTLGMGLGSIKRLSDTFDIYSQIGWGTIILSRIYIGDKPPAGQKLIIRPLVVSKPGEKVSGDGFSCLIYSDGFKVMLGDGLGHGPEANKAVNEAASIFKVFPKSNPTETLRFIHSSIKKTRGMVANITQYDNKKKEWSSSGIGNISAKWIGPVSSKNQMSYNGIVGHNIPNTMNDQHYSSAEYNQLILCSDGIRTRWEVSKYPGILKYDASILCAAIYKDHGRRTDDMSVIVIKVG